MLSFIWAEDQNKTIGYKGKLPWSLPNDLAFFKKTTLNHPMVMGKRTFESFPGLLPKREHVVLTHDKGLAKKAETTDNLTVFNDLDKLKSWLRSQSQEVFIIGGATLFKEFIPEVDRLYVTEIEHTFEGDTTMPKIQMDDFKLIFKTPGVVDQKNKYPHTFYLYERI